VEILRNYPIIKDFLNKSASLLVLGPRGAGKTRFLTGLIRDFPETITVDLLDRVLFERYLRQPERLAKEVEARLRSLETPLYVFVDEIQRIPSLLNEVHRLIERYKPRLVFILTGSSARKLRREDVNLLAGRALKIDFFPLGIDEFSYSQHQDYVLQWGTLPQAFTEEDGELRAGYLESYVGTYLQEEIQREAQLRNLEGFARFLELAAVDNGMLINYSRVGRAAGISDVTVREYYTVLRDTLLAYEIPAWSFSVRRQLQKSSKWYLFDNGVLNALTGDLRAELRPGTYRYGRLFENMVISQLKQAVSKLRSPVHLFHYREPNGREIDLILQKNPHTAPVAVEIKSSSILDHKDFSSLRAFKEIYPESRTFIICNTKVSFLHDEIECLPVDGGISRVLAEAEALPQLPESQSGE
jgi:uncharacterized protein